MDKYILLDIDGVLTSELFTKRCKSEKCGKNQYGLDWFDPFCREDLRSIVDATGVKIVISSSWRDLGIEKLRRAWEENEMPGELVGTTPVWVLPKKDAIESWIKEHPGDAYVILDDTDLGFDYQVKTDPHLGLTDEDAERAINLLNKQ